MILFLPVDGWPLGASILREFGVRPSNFFLLFAFILGLINYKYIRIRDAFTPYRIFFYIFIGILIINISILFIEFILNTIDEIQFIKGFLQFLLVIWFFISIILWRIFFIRLKVDSTGYEYFLKCIIICAFVNLIFFSLDFYNSNITPISEINDFLFFFRGEHDLRVSGLSSEPSTYASWVLLLWPLLIFTKKTLINKFLLRVSIFVGVLCLISGVICGSRTFLLILIFQALIFFLAIKKVNFLRLRVEGAIFIIGLIFTLIIFFNDGLLFYFDQIVSIFDIHNNYSSMTRLGTASAAYNMFIDNWITGVGIGQFTYSYSQYVPNWAITSPEVQVYISGNFGYRINAFNLFLRVGSEMGFIAFFLLAYFIYSILKNAYFLMKRAVNDGLWWIGILVSSIGGISYWMQQDLFSYQPGIFSIGLIMYLTKNYSAGKQ